MVPRGTKNLIVKSLAKFDQERNRSKKMQVIRLFSYSVFLSVTLSFRKGDRLLIDCEYDGHEDAITSLLIHLFRKFAGIKLTFNDISFGNVGKKSLAHAVAYQTFIGRRKPERILSFDDFFKLLDRTAEIRQRAFEKRTKNSK